MACALIADPNVVYLDEPTTGMDPVNRRGVWDVIEKAKKDRVVVLTTRADTLKVPPLAAAELRIYLRLLSARLAAQGGSAHPGGEARPLRAQPPPRVPRASRLQSRRFQRL